MSSQLSVNTSFPLKILIVEDHAIQRMVLCQLLNELGAILVDEAEDGYQALSCLESGSYDLVICDLDMPNLDGIQLMRHLCVLDKLPQLIFCSVQAADILQSVQRMGGYHELPILGCLAKPLSRSVLSPLLLRVLQLRTTDAGGAAGRYHFSRNELQHGLRVGQIQPWYQPKIDPQTSRVVSVEALARWQHPDLGLLGPAMFLPRIDETGLSEQLLCSMLEHAVRDCRHWDVQFPELKLGVAVNINMREFDQPGMPDKLKEIMQGSHLPPSRITIELTETQPLDNLSCSLENAIRLRVMGFNLALDDFGAGYSGFHHLREIPANSVKIDRTLVHHAAGDPTAEKLLGFAVRMLQSQNVAVVVEGVSRQQDFDLVKQLRVDLVQGFLLAEPMPPASLAQFIDSRHGMLMV